MMSRNRFLLLLATFVTAVSFSLPVFAHKVNMFAYAEANQVFVEGYFSDGVKPKNSEVRVFDSNGKELLTGLTNEEGQFSFTIPKVEDLRITLNAGEGHMTEYKLSQAELSGDVDDGQQAETGVAPADSNAAAGRSTTASPELQAMIQKAVGESIRPVMRGLSELKEKSSASDIIGGIGFVVGVIGLLAYFKARSLLAAANKKSGSA